METEEEWVQIHRRPRRDLFSPHDSQCGPELSDNSKRSIVCSTDGGEWRIADRWGDEGSENLQHRETCSRGDEETPQDLPQEWTGSTRFRKSSGVLCDNECENFQHRETCGSDIEQMQPLAEDDVLPDVSGGILDLRPTSQQGKRWNLRNRKDQREMLWLIRKKRLPELCHRIWPVHTVLHSLVQRANKERSLVLARPQWPCIAALSPVHDTLGVQA